MSLVCREFGLDWDVDRVGDVAPMEAESSPHGAEQDNLTFFLQEVVLPPFDDANCITEQFGDITVIEERIPETYIPTLPALKIRDWRETCSHMDLLDASSEFHSDASTVADFAFYDTSRALFTIFEDETRTP
jgi:hypothetical protein